MQRRRTPKEAIILAKDLHAGILQLRPSNWIDDDWTQLTTSRNRFTIFFADTQSDIQKYSQKQP